MIEAVIFDIDGTIVDSVDLHAKAWQVAFEKFGKKFLLKRYDARSAKAPISCCRCFYLSRR
jgi:beta-phosphoglucomutase-like phosphatase (HAD superfamily)